MKKNESMTEELAKRILGPEAEVDDIMKNPNLSSEMKRRVLTKLRSMKKSK